jgi:hypothetical protein
MADFNRHLGITIPTYRRPEWLHAAVGSMIESARPHSVPIFLADDSADDTNVGVVAELQREYEYVFHVRNEHNLGIDRNIAKSIQICDCEYAWPLGEDDLLRLDAIGQVLRRIEKGDERPPFLSVNYTLLNEDYSAVLRERFMPIRTDGVLASEEFLARWGWAIGFIGACVINKRLWNEVDPSPYLGTYWAHVGVIMESVRGRQVTMIAEPLVLKRIGSPRVFSWSDSTFQVVDGWKDLMARMVPVFGEETCREGDHSFERVFGLNGRFLIYARGEGLYDGGGFRDRVLHKGKGPFYVTIAWIIAHMPPRLARLLVQASRKARIMSQKLSGAVQPPKLPPNLS